MRNHTHTPKVPNVVRESVAWAGDEHEVAWHPKARRDLGNYLGAECALNQHEVDHNFGETPDTRENRQVGLKLTTNLGIHSHT